MAADRSGEAVEMCKAKLDALNEEIDGIERALIEAKARTCRMRLPRCPLPHGDWLERYHDVRDLLSEVANNFGEGKISLGDLVTPRHVLS